MALYWSVYYLPGTLIFDDFSTWVFPIFMHVIPVVTMTLEWFMNSIIFDYKKGAARTLWMITSFLPLSYFSKDIVGYYPYSFVDYSSWKSYAWLGGVVALNQFFYFVVARGTNYLKTSSGVSPSHFFK